MRIGLISDVHSNLDALDAVLEDVARGRIDQLVNLGDILSGALFPRQTADRLMTLRLPTIRGNHERQMVEHPWERMGASDRHAAGSLTTEQLDWITGLPATLRLNDEILMIHGTSTSDMDYLLKTVTASGPREATKDESRSAHRQRTCR